MIVCFIRQCVCAFFLSPQSIAHRKQLKKEEKKAQKELAREVEARKKHLEEVFQVSLSVFASPMTHCVALSLSLSSQRHRIKCAHLRINFGYKESILTSN